MGIPYFIRPSLEVPSLDPRISNLTAAFS